MPRPLARLVLVTAAVASCGKPHGSTTAQRAIAPEDSVLLLRDGALTEGDTLVAGAFVDRYEVAVRAGETLAVELTSGDFDPLLEVVLPEGARLMNDDWQGDRQRSRLELTTVGGGILKIQATSYAGGARGRYRIDVRRGERAAAAGTPPGAADASPALPLPGVPPGGTPEVVRAHHQVPDAGARAPIQLGQVLTGVLAPRDGRLPTNEFADVYRLDVVAGARFSVELASTEFDAYLMLVGPDGTLWENDDSSGSRNAAIEVEAPAPGAYELVATSYRPGEAGRYELKLLDRTRVGPAATAAFAPVPAPGAAQATRRARSGALDAGDPPLPSGEYTERHEFVWTAGSVVRLTVASAEFDTYLVVRAPSGTQADNDDAAPGNTNSRLDYEVRESGPHTVLVTSYRPGETGRYELLVDDGPGETLAGAPEPASPAPVAAAPVTPVVAAGAPGAQRGELSPGDPTLPSGEFFDTYAFAWPAGQAIRIDARSGEFDTYVRVRSPSGALQDNDDARSGSTDAGLDLVATEAGTYQVVVTSYRPGERGAYELAVAMPNGAPGTPAPGRPAAVAAAPTPTAPPSVLPPVAAGALAPGARIQGTLADGDAPLPSGELSDLHRIALTAGRSARLRLTSTQFDSYLLVRTPSGRRIDNDDLASGVRDAAVDLPLAEAGTYEVTVTSYRPGERGTYTLLVEEGPSVPGLDESSGRVFGLFAGISDYAGATSDLPECANDAVKLAEALRQSGLITPERQILLTDAEVTTAAVRQGLERVAREARPDDVFIFFYSGHGGRAEGGSQDPREIDGADEYLVLYDGRFMDDELGRLFDGIRARVSVLSLDACFAGGFAKDVITRPGRIGLFSSEEDVTSGVASSFQAGGYLSHFLRTAVIGEADADPRDRVLTVGELTHYLTLQFGSQVRDVRMSGGYQHLVVDRGAVPTTAILWASR